ncbi:MAG: four helix bundle protein [Bacteroidetes bacterium]|nr:MAG: four helix bundle protein [Bacteroidota bacterium]MBL1145121.1 four helix bundle protein [Bacteroidota bacterium]NOG57918.1 four helix bundle protein [Bacteroidota bacterium]
MEHNDLKDRTKKFALNVISYSKSLGNDLADTEMAKQLLRSAMSVGANTRSAFKGRGRNEFNGKLEMVIESADECGYYLELLEAQSGTNLELSDQLKQESEELTSIFGSIVKKNMN